MPKPPSRFQALEIVRFAENGAVIQKVFESNGLFFRLLKQPTEGHHPYGLKAFHPDLADATNADPVARESTRPSCVAVDGPQTTLDPQQLSQGGRIAAPLGRRSQRSRAVQ